MQYAKDLGPKAGKGVCYEQQIRLLYCRWVKIWTTDCLPCARHPLGPRFSHSSLGLVKYLKMALLSLEDSDLTLFLLFF